MSVWGCILCAHLQQVVGMQVNTGFELTQIMVKVARVCRPLNLVVNDLHVELKYSKRTSCAQEASSVSRIASSRA